jgi:hypothetical protein
MINLAESSKEGYGSKRAVFPMIMMMVVVVVVVVVVCSTTLF